MLKLCHLPKAIGSAWLLGLLLSGCANPQADSLPKFQGFLCCNMHTDGKWISDLNVASGSVRTMELGTPVQITGYGRNRVYLHFPDGDQTLGNDYSRDLDLEKFARRYVVEEDPKLRLRSDPEPVQRAIEKGQVKTGMTREQVSAALGHPVSSDTPDWNARVWRYSFADEQPYRVLWDDASRLANVAADPSTRHAVLLDADATPVDAVETATMQKERLDVEDPDRPAHAALLRSAIVGSVDGSHANPIWFLQDNSTGCNPVSLTFSLSRRKLFTVSGSQSDPAGSVAVPAGEPVRFMYHENLPRGRYCTLRVETLLEEGKNYTVVGGSSYTSGPVSILTGGASCSVGIRDDQTGLPVKVTTLAESARCAKSGHDDGGVKNGLAKGR